uniref:Evasin n=1 Tax=Rhipicephalus pulchellus TaxID=72859 RepID=L7M8Y9_RHIPC
MARRLSWLAVFLIIACHLGHGEERKPQSGHTICRYLHLYTHAGNKPVGCQRHCISTGAGKAIHRTNRESKECITVSPTGFYAMKCEVNYTCKLGLCDENDNCNPSNLLIGCWKLDEPNVPYSPVPSYGCP